MAAIRELERRLQCFLFLHLALVQLFIDYIDVLVYVFVNELHDAEELLNSIADVILQVVEHDRQWDHIVNVLLLGLIIRLKVDEQVVLGCQVTVALHVVDQLLQTMLRDHIVLDTTGRGLPLEVVKTVIMIVCWLPTG